LRKESPSASADGDFVFAAGHEAERCLTGEQWAAIPATGRSIPYIHFKSNLFKEKHS
jgi:hypothetical protein